VTAIIGRPNLKDTSVGEEIGINLAMSIRHPDFNKNGLIENDIMLLKLERSTTVTNHIVLNANDAAPADNQTVRSMGWGGINANGDQSDVLKEANMIAVSLVDCQSKWGREQDDMVCASASPRDARMCGGDSGGPLIMHGSDFNGDVQIGIASFIQGGVTCDMTQLPDVWARVSKFIGWMRMNLCNQTVVPQVKLSPTSNLCDPSVSPSKSPSSSPSKPPSASPSKSPSASPSVSSKSAKGGKSVKGMKSIINSSASPTH
jgi:secreted trypsin-like serine protease